MLEITTEESQNAISKLKKGKSPDSKGIRAEDVKACDEETREMVRQIFNGIIRREEFTPEDWEEDIQETRRLRYRQTKRATFSTSRKDLSKEIRCPACCSTQCFSTL